MSQPLRGHQRFRLQQVIYKQPTMTTTKNTRTMQDHLHLTLNPPRSPAQKLTLPEFTPPPFSPPPSQSSHSASLTNSSPLSLTGRPHSGSGVSLRFSAAESEERRTEKAQKAELTRRVERAILKNLDSLPDGHPRKQTLRELRLSWRTGLNRRGGAVPGDHEEMRCVRRIEASRRLRPL